MRIRGRRAIAGPLAITLAAGLAGCDRGAGRAPERTDATGIAARIEARRGTPVLVAFWATWCVPCVEEMPELARLHVDRDAGARVLAVSLDSFLDGERAVETVSGWLREHPTPLDHVVYFGSQDELFEKFALPGNIPYAILYDAEGRIVRRFEGAARAAEVRRALGRQAGI